MSLSFVTADHPFRCRMKERKVPLHAQFRSQTHLKILKYLYEDVPKQ